MKTEGGIYVLRCPATQAVRYVGQTVNFQTRRWVYRHTNWRLGKPLLAWLKALAAEKQKPVFEVWLIADDQRLKDRIERRLIAAYGAHLLNTNLGGRFIAEPRKVQPIYIIDDE
jgi:hypothetical protein